MTLLNLSTTLLLSTSLALIAACDVEREGDSKGSESATRAHVGSDGDGDGDSDSDSDGDSDGHRVGHRVGDVRDLERERQRRDDDGRSHGRPQLHDHGRER